MLTLLWTGAPISGRKNHRITNPVWCGSLSHQTDLSFEKTVLLAVSVQKGRKPSDATQRKNAEVRSPFLSTGRTDREAGFRRFLFPILKNVIQSNIQSGFHTLFHNTENLRFKGGFLLFLLVFILPLLAHFILTSLVILISLTCWRSWCWSNIFLRVAIKICDGE